MLVLERAAKEAGRGGEQALKMRGEGTEGGRRLVGEETRIAEKGRRIVEKGRFGPLVADVGRATGQARH